MAQKETPLTKEAATKIIKVVMKETFKEEFPKAFDKAFEPYALAIQGDFHNVRDDINELKQGQEEIKEDLSDVKDTVGRIELTQKAEMKRADDFSIRLDTHQKQIAQLKHKMA